MTRFTILALAQISACLWLAFPPHSFAADAPSPLAGLDVFRGEFPLSLRFRAERYDNGSGRHAPPLLNAPNFAHGCVCNYPFLTSFALVHLPEAAKGRPTKAPSVHFQRNLNTEWKCNLGPESKP